MTLARRVLDDFRGNPVAHGAILLVPAIQYGLNYFASFAAVLFIAVAWSTRLRVLPLPTAVVAVAAALSLLWATITMPEVPLMLRELRLFGGLLLLFWLLAGTPRYDLGKFNGNWALLMLAGLALFTLAQAVAGRKGISLYAPQWLFVNSSDYSLAAAWVAHAREHDYAFQIRPCAGFSEPSYLGGVSLMLNFICLHTLKGRKQIAASAIAVAACAVSQTFYGMLANLLITGVYHHRRFNKPVVISLGVVVLALVALPIFAAEPGRIERILTGEDVSTGLRVTQPFELISFVLAHDPFGIPMTAINGYFQQHGLLQAFEDAPFHNGSLNLIFSYGWLGFPVLFLLLMATGNPICALFMLLLMSQNGAPFDFDKLFMLSFAIQIARHAQQRLRPRWQTEPVFRA